MNRRPISLLVAGLLGALLALGPCRSGALAAAEPPYQIDAILSLTGSGAFVGKSENDVLQLLENSLNAEGGIRGRAVHIVVHDDQTSPQVAVQLVNQIIAANGTVLLGPSLTAQCLAVMPLVQGKLLHYCISPGIHPEKGGYTFSAGVSTTDLITAFVRYFHRRGWNRIAALIPSDATGQDADRNLARVFALPENRGATLVAKEYLAPADLTVDAQMSKIKAADPQALIVWTIGAPTATVLHGMIDAGVSVPVAFSNANMTYAQMKQWSAILPKDAYYPGAPFLAGRSSSAQSAVALRTFHDATVAQGLTPDFQTGLPWDPAQLIVAALRSLGTGASASQIRDYIENIHDFAGIMGVYDFRDGSQRGLSESNVIVMRWDPAKTTWVAVSAPGGLPLAARP